VKHGDGCEKRVAQRGLRVGRETHKQKEKRLEKETQKMQKAVRGRGIREEDRTMQT
jgi:hypothetical protein